MMKCPKDEWHSKCPGFLFPTSRDHFEILLVSCLHLYHLRHEICKQGDSNCFQKADNISEGQTLFTAAWRDLTSLLSGAGALIIFLHILVKNVLHVDHFETFNDNKKCFFCTCSFAVYNPDLKKPTYSYFHFILCTISRTLIDRIKNMPQNMRLDLLCRVDLWMLLQISII